ncbi:hypothetical protein V8E54_012024 [Elaphomyces granulatus]
MAPSRPESPDPSIASTNTKRWRNGIDLETADNDEVEGFIEWRIKVYKREEKAGVAAYQWNMRKGEDPKTAPSYKKADAVSNMHFLRSSSDDAIDAAKGVEDFK